MREGFVEVGAADVWDFSTDLALEAAVQPGAVARLGTLARRARTTGALAGPTYDVIRGVTGVVGAGIAVLLGHEAPPRNNAFAYQWFGDLHGWLRALDGDWRRLPRELRLVSDADRRRRRGDRR